MFKCLVIACLISNPSYCQVLENTEYPVVYKTYDECKVRAMEIASQIPIFLRGYRATKWKCKEVQEGKFL
tara:strand:+ start:2815 stop:3024 length:210 start_codon:yes stop_codon:yes gene_type:complete